MGDKKKGIRISIAAILVISVFATFAITPVSAQPTNWGFETGDLTGWTVVAGNVEVLQSANFAPNIIAPPEGRFFALLSNGPGDQGVSTTQNRDFALGPENDIAILQRTFTTTRTMTLTFNLAFLTSEENTELRYDDIFEVITMDGVQVVNGSAPQSAGESSPFLNYGPLDGLNYLVTSPGPTSGSLFNDGRTNFSTYTVTVGPGTHTIEFYVGDQGNHGVDSGILIDAVPAAPVPTLTPIGIVALAGLLSAVAAISIKTSIRKKRR
jgi:hypothetical protein